MASDEAREMLAAEYEAVASESAPEFEWCTAKAGYLRSGRPLYGVDLYALRAIEKALSRTSTNEDAVEAVARAICVADGHDPDEHIFGNQAAGFEDYGPRWQADQRAEGQLGSVADYVALARAAIAAMPAPAIERVLRPADGTTLPHSEGWRIVRSVNPDGPNSQLLWERVPPPALPSGGGDIRARTIEECARVADQVAVIARASPYWREGEDFGPTQIAERIRSLSALPEPEGEG